MTDERTEIRNKIAVAVYDHVPGDLPASKVNTLIDRMTDITLDAIAEMNGEQTGRPIPIPSGPIAHTPPAPPQPFDPYAPGLPPVFPEPEYNDQNFGVGFRMVHPPGVECAFPPPHNRCSCGKSAPDDTAAED